MIRQGYHDRLGTQHHEILGRPGVRADPSSGTQRLVSYLVRSTPFFTALDNWVNLTLVEVRTFPDGVLLTRYETKR